MVIWISQDRSIKRLARNNPATAQMTGPDRWYPDSSPSLGRGALTPLDYYVAPGWDSVKSMERFMLTPCQGGRDK